MCEYYIPKTLNVTWDDWIIFPANCNANSAPSIDKSTEGMLNVYTSSPWSSNLKFWGNLLKGPTYSTDILVVTFKEELTRAMRYENSTLSPTTTCLSDVENKGTTKTPGGDVTNNNQM